MRVLLSGGGTAGHINPALALAEALQQRGVEVSFAGTPNGLESRLVPQAGIPFTAYEAKGFNRSHPLTLPKALLTLSASTKQAKRDFQESRPDAVVAFGGYVCIPVGRAAESLGIPVVVHEQNSVMGMANKYLAKRAAQVCLTYEHAAKDVAGKGRVLVTGNPVRRSVFQATRAEGREAFGIPEDAVMLLVTGGSLGARHINQAMAALKGELLGRPDVYVVHLTGPKELEAVQRAMGLSADEAARWQLLGYTDRMGLAMAAADAVVSRAGATSLAEILGTPRAGASGALSLRHGGPPDQERSGLGGCGLRLRRGRRCGGDARVRREGAAAGRRRPAARLHAAGFGADGDQGRRCGPGGRGDGGRGQQIEFAVRPVRASA